VHFTDAAGNILFQGDHNAPPEWTAGTLRTSVAVNVPASPGGAADVRAGLYRPGEGTRILPEGPDDGAHRVRLGSVDLSDFRFTAYAPPPDPTLSRLNPEGRLVSFEGVVTNGALRITPGELTPLPGGGPFEIRLRGAPRPQSIEALDESGNTTASLQPLVEGGDIVIRRDPAVFTYRLK